MKKHIILGPAVDCFIRNSLVRHSIVRHSIVRNFARHAYPKLISFLAAHQANASD
jgi:hypothetical protein